MQHRSSGRGQQFQSCMLPKRGEVCPVVDCALEKQMWMYPWGDSELRSRGMHQQKFKFLLGLAAHAVKSGCNQADAH
eukprot:1144966-Pelagomonas_calceolata.AAC.2